MAARWAYWDAINDVYHGLSREQVRALYAEADGLINLCGATRLRDEHLRCPVRIMIDTDPVYEQIKYAKADPAARAYRRRPHPFLPMARISARPDCPIPLSGCRGGRPAAGRSRPVAAAATGSAPPASRRSRPGKTRARTSTSTARAISGRSTSIFSNSSTCRGTGREPASAWRCCRRRGGPAQVEGAGWDSSIRARFPPTDDSYRDFIAGSRASSRSPRTSMSGPTAAGSAIARSRYLAAGAPVVTMRTGFTTTSSRSGTGSSIMRPRTRRSPRSMRSRATIRRHSRAARELAGDCFAGRTGHWRAARRGGL